MNKIVEKENYDWADKLAYIFECANRVMIQEEAFKKGIKVNKMEIAAAMLEEKEDINKIIKYTGLTKEEINELKEEN